MENILSQYTVNVNWARIHSLVEAVAKAGKHVSHIGTCHPLGGSYYAPRYESRGLAGLIEILSAAESYRDAAWKTIHGASTALKSARKIDGNAVRRKGERRTVFARRAAYNQVVCRENAEEMVIESARSAVKCCFALHALFWELDAIGVCQYDARSVICGVTDTTLHVTGLYWLAGCRTEPLSCPVQVARAFADHGIEALEATVIFPPMAA